ncbi:hypothetical protein [Pseudoxanthomonas sp. PXM02]|uniref:hypothetical protein n=1 Tax=Pseudoxanthomonas sp. PXM02 TaxID=2769294 RepID=UPI00177DBEE3|nr:hypothetical protein [Pseudoxanthomonas sp. PXM02]MBD9478733.1 hypothetical protein [Pseudoxanthomonas sp. PXM02]
MDTDLIFITSVTGLAAIAVVIVVLLPAWIAWMIAWRSGMPTAYRRSFALVCLLLSYGFIMLAGALLLPLDIFKTFIAPDLHDRGHVVLGNTIFVLAEQGAPIISFAAGLVAAILIPLRLSRHWIAITGFIRPDAAPPPAQRDMA